MGGERVDIADRLFPYRIHVQKLPETVSEVEVLIFPGAAYPQTP